MASPGCGPIRRHCRRMDYRKRGKGGSRSFVAAGAGVREPARSRRRDSRESIKDPVIVVRADGLRTWNRRQAVCQCQELNRQGISRRN